MTSGTAGQNMRGTEPHVLASPIKLRRQSKGARHAETCHSVQKRVAEACLRCLSFQMSATCWFVCSRVTAGSRWPGSPTTCRAQGGAVSISNFPVAAPQPNHKSDDDKVGAVAVESEIVFEKRSAKQGSPMLIWHEFLQSQRCRTSNPQSIAPPALLTISNLHRCPSLWSPSSHSRP
jgi:hypothetical protein